MPVPNQQRYTFWRSGVLYELLNGQLIREIPKNGVAREWHPNRRLARESNMVHGVAQGIIREWHDNGQLAKETPIDRGKIHGEVKQWSRDGRLLGTNELRWGIGTSRTWCDDGSIDSESEIIEEGVSRGRVWDDLGKPHETFSIDGRTVSKKTFLKKIQSLEEP
jgi:hypothetical protein